MFPKIISARHWALLVLFLLGLLFFDLGGRGLNEPDEGRYADIALEMLQPGQTWWDPSMLGVGHYDKPPLIYWTTALSFKIFGLNEWAARLPSFIGALLTLAGLAWATWRRQGARVAWIATLIAGTLVHLWAMARELSPDMLMTGFCTLAIAAWTETRQRGGAWRWWLLQVLFWTLAFWTKATPALIPMLGLALYVYLADGREGRRALKLPWLLPLSVALASPWFLVVVHLHPELKDFFLRREAMGRITGHVTGRRGPVYYYLLTSLIAWLPWWPLAAVALFRQRAEMKSSGPKRWSLEVFLIATGLIVFSLISSKLPTYTLPLAPWVALLMARWLDADLSFLRPPRLIIILSSTALLYATIILSFAPRWESFLGRNATVRDAVDYALAHGATGLHADRLIFALEFYGGENVHFAEVPAPSEIHDGSDEPGRFFDADSLGQIGPGDWFIHYRPQPESPFQRWIDDPQIPKATIGDFIVGPLNPAPR